MINLRTPSSEKFKLKFLSVCSYRYYIYEFLTSLMNSLNRKFKYGREVSCLAYKQNVRVLKNLNYICINIPTNIRFDNSNSLLLGRLLVSKLHNILLTLSRIRPIINTSSCSKTTVIRKFINQIRKKTQFIEYNTIRKLQAH